MPDRQKKSRDYRVEKSHATSQSDPGKGHKTRSRVQHPVRSTKCQATWCRGQKHKREYEAKTCDSPSQAIARRRYRGSAELVAEPDAYNTGTGSPLPVQKHS